MFTLTLLFESSYHDDDTDETCTTSVAYIVNDIVRRLDTKIYVTQTMYGVKKYTIVQILGSMSHLSVIAERYTGYSDCDINQLLGMIKRSPRPKV